MGRTGNGDGWSDGAGAPDDLPQIPADWGPIVVPDDPAALAAEAELVRRELRRTRRRDRWHRRLGLRSDQVGHRPHEIAALRLPLTIMLVAVLAAMVSLFIVAWTDRPPPSPGQSAEPSVAPSAAAGSATLPAGPLPALDLIDPAGRPVALHALLPAVILLVDSCDCADQVAAARGAAPAGVSVVAVTDRPDPAAGTDGNAATPATDGSDPLPATEPAVHRLADPTGEIRDFVDVTPVADTATVLLVARGGDVVRLVPAARTTETYRADLAGLVSQR
ncbi:hypothetical protein O7623_23510 [Solwaraspora sp. WMMD791]|uniref:hypothetical protein n=1 Tax=Solwaraspora sp. WMMD791 TaxID=3016086 RepID=UPI002499E0C5|nr:hypothetical protein [Solwaraspora sp. WMMD791]WFE26282.1 hypothetical protein O7623_23510 [Solwaraspora sp. WMMD791]